MRATDYTEYKNDLEMIRAVVNDKNIALPLSVSLLALLRLFESGQYLIKDYAKK